MARKSGIQRRTVLNSKATGIFGAVVAAAVVGLATPVQAHHSFAIFDAEQTTVFSVALHPLRSGEPAGSRRDTGAIYKCPEKTPPAPGKNCDSVEGHTTIGTGALPEPTLAK